jgi:hypothetical protein
MDLVQIHFVRFSFIHISLRWLPGDQPITMDKAATAPVDILNVYTFTYEFGCPDFDIGGDQERRCSPDELVSEVAAPDDMRFP